MLRLLIGGLAGAVFVPFLLHGAALKLPTPTLEPARWAHEALVRKLEIAKETDQPQLLIVAGSNALFGFSAKLITEFYGFPATNLAVAAGFGRKYMFEQAKKVAKKGDLVVVAMEYELWEEERFQLPLAYEVLAHDQAYYQSFAPLDKLRLLANISVSDWMRFAKNRVVADTKLATGYQAATLNDRGDETNNRKGTIAAEVTGKAGSERTRAYHASPSAIADLKDLDAHLKRIGARLVVTYPNFLEPAFDHVNDGFIADVRRLTLEAGIAFVGDHADRLFGLEDGYDTTYHQNHIGQEKSTHILMRQLRAANVALPNSVISSLE
jgi:hypothetical protein